LLGFGKLFLNGDLGVDGLDHEASVVDSGISFEEKFEQTERFRVALQLLDVMRCQHAMLFYDIRAGFLIVPLPAKPAAALRGIGLDRCESVLRTRFWATCGCVCVSSSTNKKTTRGCAGHKVALGCVAVALVALDTPASPGKSTAPVFCVVKPHDRKISVSKFYAKTL
jgi:hypothetical protein